MKPVLRLAAAGLGLAVLAACSTTTVAGRPEPASTGSAAAGSPASRAPHSRVKVIARPAVRVHASLLESDGRTYGVGMPIVVRFTRKVTDAAAFERAAVVKVNGVAADGAWYWEASGARGYVLEAHYRLGHYWPAHSHVDLALPIKGVSAGRGRAFDDSLTLSMDVGAAHVSTVDANSGDPHMTVTSDGRTVRVLPASLGAATNPTYRGTKIVEEFDRVEDMEGTPVPWSVRVTNSGEFVHAAPWNSEIGRANLSHGCTNLSTADARWFYNFSRLGDVVEYPNAPGRTMQVWDGLGDWNVQWPAWRAGGLL